MMDDYKCPTCLHNIYDEKYCEYCGHNENYEPIQTEPSVPMSVIDDIKAEIREETECHYGDKCLGANCPSNTDCMIMGEHAIWIIDKHIRERSE